MTSTRTKCSILLSGFLAAAALGPATPAAAQPADLPDQVGDAADPDILRALEEAEGMLKSKNLDGATDTIIGLLLGTNRFDKAQQAAIAPRAIELLHRAGQAQRAAGNLPGTARAFDARWSLQGLSADLEYAGVLTEWARKHAAENPGEALYLARRARIADPAASAAIELDDELSSNNKVALGRTLQISSAVALVVGIWALSQASGIRGEIEDDIHSRDELDDLLAARRRYGWIGTASVLAAPVLFVSGNWVIVVGNPSYSPVSPAALPALGEEP